MASRPSGDRAPRQSLVFQKLTPASAGRALPGLDKAAARCNLGADQSFGFLGGQDMSSAASGVPERRTFTKGTIIFREGDKGSEAYLVQQGAVRIFKTVNGRRITLGQCKPFQIFGELALMDDAPRMAAAEASEDTTVLVVSKATIRDMLDCAPLGLNNLIQSLIATMRAMGEDLATTKAQLIEARGAV